MSFICLILARGIAAGQNERVWEEKLPWRLYLKREVKYCCGGGVKGGGGLTGTH